MIKTLQMCEEIVVALSFEKIFIDNLKIRKLVERTESNAEFKDFMKRGYVVLSKDKQRKVLTEKAFFECLKKKIKQSKELRSNNSNYFGMLDMRWVEMSTSIELF